MTDVIACHNFPCQDINKDCYTLPEVEIDPETIKILMISEASPPDLTDYFYADNNPFYMGIGISLEKNTIQPCSRY